MEQTILSLISLVVIVLVIKVAVLSRQVHKLEWELRRPRSLPRPSGTPPAPPPQPVSPSAQAVPSLLTGELPPARSRTRAEWEALVGGQLMNRIGAVALILATGFFLKYAFDNDWLTEVMRVLIGAVAGVLLLIGGAHFHRKKLNTFAQGLQGAGIAILYLTVYASFGFYDLTSRSVAFVLMSLVTVAALVHALYYDARAISLLGWAGGFLTPFLLSTGEVNTVGLFTYILLLDIGLIAVLVKRDAWAILEPLTLGATYLTWFIWYGAVDLSEEPLPGLLFLTVFWGLFYALDLIRILSSTPTFPRLRRLVASANALFYYAGMYALIDEYYDGWTAPMTLAVGVVYFATLLLIQRRTENETVQAQFALTALVLLVLATAIRFTGVTTVALWSLEALALVVCGLRWARRSVWMTALGLYGLAALKLFATPGALAYAPIQAFVPFFNERAGGFMVLAGTLGLSATLFAGRTEIPGRKIQAGLHVGWCMVLFVWLSVATHDYFRLLRSGEAAAGSIDRLINMEQLTLSGAWLVYSIAIMGIGMWRQVAALRVIAIVCFGLSILKIFIYDLSFLDTLFRIFSFFGLGLILLAVSYLYQRYRAVLLRNEEG